MVNDDVFWLIRHNSQLRRQTLARAKLRSLGFWLFMGLTLALLVTSCSVDPVMEFGARPVGSGGSGSDDGSAGSGGTYGTGGTPGTGGDRVSVGSGGVQGTGGDTGTGGTAAPVWTGGCDPFAPGACAANPGTECLVRCYGGVGGVQTQLQNSCQALPALSDAALGTPNAVTKNGAPCGPGHAIQAVAAYVSCGPGYTCNFDDPLALAPGTGICRPLCLKESDCAGLSVQRCFTCAQPDVAILTACLPAGVGVCTPTASSCS